MLPSEETAEVTRRELLDWYRKNRRDLPWRKNKDPYRIWVSEVMLQQTRVDTVIPYYERFMERFPTLEDLAKATEDEVVKEWEGLGYYSRARNLHSAVKEVVASYGGKVPSEPETISRLKGIGPYTKGAILSIAYDKKVPAVDGNVMRVFSRLFALTDDIARQSTRKKMERIAETLIPESAPGDFNQALMELGALICTPQSPQCLFCPVQSVCQAFREGLELELPRKKKAKPPATVDMIFAWIICGNRVLVEKRPETGLLAGMWALPTFEQVPDQTPEQAMDQYCDTKAIPASNYKIKGRIEHVFSHRHWKVVIIQAQVSEPDFPLPDGWEWVEKEELHQRAFPNVYRKAIKQLL